MDDHWSLLVITIVATRWKAFCKTVQLFSTRHNIFTQLLSSCFDENVYKSVLAEVLPDKGEIKADRELEVQLDCGTLVISADGVLDLNVNLQRRDTNDEQCLSYWVSVRACC